MIIYVVFLNKYKPNFSEKNFLFLKYEKKNLSYNAEIFLAIDCHKFLTYQMRK